MSLSLARRPSSSQQQPLAAAEEDPTVVADGARKSDHSLSMLHACVHCRASKTACADERPCAPAEAEALLDADARQLVRKAYARDLRELEYEGEVR